MNEQIYYLSDGREVLLHNELPDGLFLVETLIWVDTGDESYQEPSGYFIRTKNIFEAPPIESKSAAIVKLDADIERLREEKAVLEKEYKQLEKNIQDRKQRRGDIPGLAEIDDLIADKVQYLVLFGYSAPAIVPLEEALKVKGDSSRYPKLRLLSLFGKKNNYYTGWWEINQYPDGSGSSQRCKPARDINEARKIVQDYFDESIENKYSHNQWLTIENWIKMANEYGLHIAEKYINYVLDMREQENQKEVERLVRAIERKQTSLAKLRRKK